MIENQVRDDFDHVKRTLYESVMEVGLVYENQPLYVFLPDLHSHKQVVRVIDIVVSIVLNTCSKSPSMVLALT